MEHYTCSLIKTVHIIKENKKLEEIYQVSFPAELLKVV